MILTEEKESIRILFPIVTSSDMSPTWAGLESSPASEVEGRLPASAMTPPHNNLSYKSSLG